MIFFFSFLNLWSPVATLCVAFFLVLFWNCRYYWRRRIDSCAQHLIGLPRRRRSDGIEGGGVGLPKSLLIQIFRRPRAPSAATSSLFQVEEDSGSIFAPLLSLSTASFLRPCSFFFVRRMLKQVRQADVSKTWLPCFDNEFRRHLYRWRSSRDRTWKTVSQSSLVVSLKRERNQFFHSYLNGRD